MDYRLRISEDIVKLIRELHPLLKKKVRGALQKIVNDPYCGKALRDELNGLYSLRASRFRIIFRLSEGKIIEIVAIGPRKNIYEETFRIISKKRS